MLYQKYLSIILSICFIINLQQQSIAQGCCSGGTPLSGNLDISTSDPKNLSVRLTFDHNNLGDVVFERKELEDKTRTRITNATLLRLDYAFNDWLAISTLFSYISQEERIKFNTVDNSTIGQGLGDIVVLLQYNAYKKKDTNVSFAGGFKAPTGPIDRTNDDTGLLLNPDLQPGTGSWDFLAVGQFTQRNIFINFLNFKSSITYRLTTEASRFNQLQEYKFGNELQSYLGFNYNWYLKKTQVVPQLMLRYRHTQVDKIDGNPSPNTGGNWFYLVPGVEVYPSQRFGIGLLSELPIARNLDGIQLTTSYKITASLSYRFAFKQKLETPKVF